jgi:hypothetical protein
VNAESIARALGGAAKIVDGWKAKCPAHRDDTPSLALTDGNDGRVLVYCHAGCAQADVIAALAATGLWPNGEQVVQQPAAQAEKAEKTPIIPVPPGAPPMSFRHPEFGKPVKTWPYHTIDDRLVAYIARFNTRDKNGDPDKTFRPITYCDLGDGKCRWRSEGVPEPRPLYRLPQVVAKTNVPILVTEGEKAADAAQKLFPDYVATTTMHGAKSPDKADWSPVSGRQVVIWPDADEPGMKFAEAVARLAMAAGALDVRIVAIPEAFPKAWDLADTPPEGWTVEKLRELLKPKTNGSDGGIQTTSGAYGNQPSERVVLGGIEKLVITLDQLNEEFAFLEMPGQRAAIILRADASPITNEDFAMRVADKVVRVTIEDKHKTKVKYISAAKFWRESTGKHRYRLIVFTSKPFPPDAMNLFGGFGVTPRPGKCDLIIKHIEEVICRSNETLTQ